MRLFIIIAFIVCSHLVSGQVRTTPPTPPTPPTPATPGTKVTVNSNTSVTISGKTYISSSTSSGKGEASSSKVKIKQNSSNSSTSVSIDNSDITYSIRASFDDHKTERIKKLLMENLEKEHLTAKGDSYVWKRIEDEDIAYSFALSDGRLRAFVNKELNSKSSIERFVALGEKISDALSEK